MLVEKDRVSDSPIPQEAQQKSHPAFDPCGQSKFIPSPEDAHTTLPHSLDFSPLNKIQFSRDDSPSGLQFSHVQGRWGVDCEGDQEAVHWLQCFTSHTHTMKGGVGSRL